jgi:hypothetical protein
LTSEAQLKSCPNITSAPDRSRSDSPDTPAKSATQPFWPMGARNWPFP